LVELTHGANFINILRPAVMGARAYPKIVKKTDNLTVFFSLLGSLHIKAAHKMLVGLTHGGLRGLLLWWYETQLRRNPDAIIAEHVNKSGLMGAVQKLHSICDDESCHLDRDNERWWTNRWWTSRNGQVEDGQIDYGQMGDRELKMNEWTMKKRSTGCPWYSRGSLYSNKTADNKGVVFSIINIFWIKMCLVR